MTLGFSAPVRFTGFLASRLLRLLPPPSRPSRYLRGYIASRHSASMGKQATLLMRTVSGYPTESLDIHSEESSLHIIVIPGNPGIASYYKDFVEAVYQLLEGQASITAIGHVSHSAKDWEHGRMFSLEEQIAHKVGHSIGSYICLEVFKRRPQQVKYVIGLYPFLTLNKNSFKQSIIGLIARSSVISAATSYFASLLRSLPISVQYNMVRQFLGKTWSATAVAVTCSHLLQYHTMRNMLFLAMTEFEKLSEEPDWMFMKRKHNQISLLFGMDDHWAPLSHFEGVSRQVPGLALAVEREGHMHAFCCTQAGSSWVGHHVASLIRNQIAK
ncbi:uncharacterized protein LOC141835603 [Curcuma longa]|uniref:uncharacterized protein LOC141835603 n=1 Tax=Curcuma longa TaxID=136217 RepID=UPI003D9DE03F